MPPSFDTIHMLVVGLSESAVMPMAVAQDSTPKPKDEQDEDATVVADLSTLSEYRSDVGSKTMDVASTGAHSHSIVD